MRGSGRAEHCDKYVEIGCPCSSKFRTWSNAQLLEAVDVATNAAQQCADGHIRPSRLEAIQKNLGFRCTSLGLLADPTLRAHADFMKVLQYDWAHTFLSDGIVGAEIWALIDAGQRHHLFSQETVYEFLAGPWVFPASKGKKRARRLTQSMSANSLTSTPGR